MGIGDAEPGGDDGPHAGEAGLHGPAELLGAGDGEARVGVCREAAQQVLLDQAEDDAFDFGHAGPGALGRRGFGDGVEGRERRVRLAVRVLARRQVEARLVDRRVDVGEFRVSVRFEVVVVVEWDW